MTCIVYYTYAKVALKKEKNLNNNNNYLKKIINLTTYPAPNLLKSLFDCKVYAVSPRNTAVVRIKACKTMDTSKKLTINRKSKLSFKEHYPMYFLSYLLRKQKFKLSQTGKKIP